MPEGRSAATRERAAEAGLRPVGSLAEPAGTCGVVLSVCPLAAALDVARQIAATGFEGIHVDADAISPRAAAETGALFRGGAVTVVDGGITGPPPRAAGRTRLYLSGGAAAVEEVSALLLGTLLTPVALDGPSGGRPR
ncbi:hypothetical protein [Streptomyces sp. NPDC001410]|uniref:hypothetical protein n=1 Tax=Streptomyces sp. NPDC001410 TaxID=3364574 RepID=UPI003683380A